MPRDERREGRERGDIVGDEVGPRDGGREQVAHGEALPWLQLRPMPGIVEALADRAHAAAAGAASRNAAMQYGSNDITATGPL